VKMFSKDSQAKLHKLLKEELGIWEQIRELTEKQTELVSSDEVDALNKSIDDRQELIEKINGLHQESDILMQSYISVSGSSGEKSAEIEALVSKIREKIVSCSQLNDKNVSSAKGVKEAVIERADDLGKKRKTIGAYAPSLPNNSEMVDKKF